MTGNGIENVIGNVIENAIGNVIENETVIATAISMIVARKERNTTGLG